MTTKELLELPKVRVEDAARYLQNGTSADDIRIMAQANACNFCRALKKTGSRRYYYRIHIGNLINEKFPDGVPEDG